MSGEVRYINAAVDVLVRNVVENENDYVYRGFDKDWNIVARFNQATGAHARVFYRDAQPATPGYLAHPKQVVLEVLGPLELEPKVLSHYGTRIYPSSTGMYLDSPKPIFVRYTPYSLIDILGGYTIRFDIKDPRPFFIECDSYSGVSA